MAFSGHFFDIKNKGHQAVSHDGPPCKRSFFLSHSRDVFQDDAANPINAVHVDRHRLFGPFHHHDDSVLDIMDFASFRANTQVFRQIQNSQQAVTILYA